LATLRWASRILLRNWRGETRAFLTSRMASMARCGWLPCWRRRRVNATCAGS
jgi:hypothetical protein